MATLRKEREDLVSERKIAEDAYYNFATTECDMEEDVAQSKITKARLEPQKNARLQSIHVIHQAVLSKEAEITETGANLQNISLTLTQNERVDNVKTGEMEKDLLVCVSKGICVYEVFIIATVHFAFAGSKRFTRNEAGVCNRIRNIE